MRSLRKSYNRKYCWRVFKIRYREQDKLFALWIAAKLIKLAFKISPDLMREMGFRK